MDGSGANLNLQGLQSTTVPNAPDVANILQQVPATTVAAKQSSPAKKPEKEQDKVIIIMSFLTGHFFSIADNADKRKIMDKNLVICNIVHGREED